MKCGFRLRVSLQHVINLYCVHFDYSGFLFAFHVTFPRVYSPTHKATHFLYSIHSRPSRSRVHLRFRTVLCSVFSLKWSERFRISSRNTRNDCRRCRLFRRARTDVRSYVKTMVQTGISSRTVFCDHGLAVHFLNDVGLIQSKVQCATCDRDMTWCAHPTFSDGFKWQCWRMVAGVRCSASRSITTFSWFQLSKLTFRENSLLKYGIVCREPAHRIIEEYCLSSSTVDNWGMFCWETMHLFMTPTKPLHGYNAVSAPHYIRDGGHLLFLVLKYVHCDVPEMAPKQMTHM